jgi:hypothetical protein
LSVYWKLAQLDSKVHAKVSSRVAGSVPAFIIVPTKSQLAPGARFDAVSVSRVDVEMELAQLTKPALGVPESGVVQIKLSLPPPQLGFATEAVYPTPAIESTATSIAISGRSQEFRIIAAPSEQVSLRQAS